MRLIGDARPRDVSVRDAAVRTDFYRRERPDGSAIYDIEWSLSQLEDSTAPLLRDLKARWPLSDENKMRLAVFMGYQLVRGPRWKHLHETMTREFIDEQRRAGRVQVDEEDDVTADEVLDAAEKHLVGSTPRTTRMLNLAPKVASVLGSMHWSLIEFRRPLIATSDHPVVLWPIGTIARSPEPTPLRSGLLHTLEIRFPISPELVLLMTWLDDCDTLMPLRGTRDHAANVNAFTVAEAERQWFHMPGSSPPIASGRLLPISPSLIPPYDRVSADSARRKRIGELIQPRLGDSGLNQDVEIVKVARPAG